ncbi:MAG: hypothetical protein M3T55_05885 [Pseudomonadota bacterium]|nr:hypothetical protein [Pseudomonadota bacterium]
MTRTAILGAIAAAALLAGCAGGPGYYGGGPGYGVAVGYDGYYDGFYGPIYDGYWRGRSFYWRDRDGGRWRRDDGRHFRHEAANGFRHIQGERHPDRRPG